jgi:hypothetical protein
MKKETGSLIWGIILIIIGFLFLGNNLNWFSFGLDELWPSLIILGGLFFWFGWLTNRSEFGLLMPGSILVIYGAMFQYSALYGWYYMDILWPGFLLGPGLGFLFMYLLGNREKGLLFPASILIVLSVIFWIGKNSWPLVLIVLGIFLLFKDRFQPAKKTEIVEEEPQKPREQ